MFDTVVEIDVDAEIGVVVEFLVELYQFILLLAESRQLPGQTVPFGCRGGFLDAGGQVVLSGTHLVLQFVQV